MIPADPTYIIPEPYIDTPGTPEPTPQAIPSDPLPSEADETLDALRSSELPGADLHELGVRFLDVPEDTARTISTVNPDYPVDTQREFSVSNVDADLQFEIDATLIYKTDHVYMWVENDYINTINTDNLIEAAELFEEHTYPTNHEFFGSEWLPGVDGDPHLSILHAGNLGGTVAGYFSSPDSYVKSVRADSNEMEMFYINIDNVIINSDFYNGVLAHEFQHMIHWYNDGNEDTWLNEGCSELAMELNDRAYPGNHYEVGGSHFAYLSRPDTQLTTWPEGTAGSADANYGGAFLFTSYFLDRFGEDATKALVAHHANGMDSIDAVLEQIDAGISHKEFYADWMVANLLDDPQVEDGHYNYPNLDMPDPRIDETHLRNSYPIEQRASVHQYGVDYIEVNSDTPLHFTFNGSNQVGLIDAEAHSGKYLWWSNRADESDARLTHIIDLSGKSEAELQFWAWYHIEEDWDYAYVVVGTSESGSLSDSFSDADLDWEILSDTNLKCNNDNPNNNNFGCGLTGSSNGWQELSADLSSYAGQEIALRFEYITDAAVNQAGFAIDDIRIIADGQEIISNDVEDAASGWLAEGFVRHANVLPQEWIVQIVTYGSETKVQRLLMAEVDQTAVEWDIPFDGTLNSATIIISAIAPVTTEMADYEYSLTP